MINSVWRAPKIKNYLNAKLKHTFSKSVTEILKNVFKILTTTNFAKQLNSSVPTPYQFQLTHQF